MMDFFRTLGISAIPAFFGFVILWQRLKRERRHKLADSLRKDFLGCWNSSVMLYGFVVNLEKHPETCDDDGALSRAENNVETLMMKWLELSPFVSKRIDDSFSDYMVLIQSHIESVKILDAEKSIDLGKRILKKIQEIKVLIRKEFF